jgi:hypothetical protein
MDEQQITGWTHSEIARRKIVNAKARKGSQEAQGAMHN